MPLRDYEQEILREVGDWETGKQGHSLFARASRLFGKPVDWVMSMPASQQALDTVSEVIFKSLSNVYSVSGRTFSRAGIERTLKEAGLSEDELKAVAKADIRKLDTAANSCLGPNALAATLEGAGCGMGGMILIAADLPVLMGICFRLIQQIACCYGYDPADDLELDIALKILQIAGGPPESRQKTLLELEAALTGVRTGGTKIGLFAGVIAIRELSRLLGTQLTRRKLAQLVPLVGVGIGAGVNYAFTREVGQAAHMVYRKRLLLDKLDAGELRS